MNKKKIIGVVIGVMGVVLISGVTAYTVVNNKPVVEKQDLSSVSQKHITIEVIDSNMEKKTYSVATRSRNIKGVLDEVVGLTMEYDKTKEGYTIVGVNGEVVDTKKNIWTYTLNNDFSSKTIDKQEINHGDKIVLYYSTM